MPTMRRFRRRILSILIGLLGGSGVLMGPLIPDARAIGVAPNDSSGKTTGVTDTTVNSRLVAVQGYDSRMKMTERDVFLRQDIFDQQQEILLKMEELKQQMQDLELKLKNLEEAPANQ